jgi:hypothetical protein
VVLNKTTSTSKNNYIMRRKREGAQAKTSESASTLMVVATTLVDLVLGMSHSSWECRRRFLGVVITRVSVCVGIKSYALMTLRARTHMHSHTHTLLCAHTHTYTLMRTHTHIHSYAHTHTHTHSLIRKHTYTCTHMHSPPMLASRFTTTTAPLGVLTKVHHWVFLQRSVVIGSMSTTRLCGRYRVSHLKENSLEHR